MKKLRSKFWMIIMAGAFLLTSCGDDNETPDQLTQTNPTPDVPSDADAVLAAIEVIAALPPGTPTVPGLGDITLDVANANFFSSGLGSSLVNVGNVSINTNQLQNLSGNTYTNNPQAIDAGISVGSRNTWEVAGANGFAAFSHTTAKVMPQQVKFAASVADTFSNGGEITLTVQSIPANSDNILWVLSDGTRVLTKESRTTSVTFSASEVGTLRTTSAGIVQAAAYNTESQTFGGKKIYFINETVDSKIITIN